MEDKGTWTTCEDTAAKKIIAAMRMRKAEVVPQLASLGLLVLSGDRPIILDDGQPLSVDIRCRHQGQKCDALIELKWTRRCLIDARRKGEQKLHLLKRASLTGHWMQPSGRRGNRIHAPLVGVLAVGPSSWECRLEAAVDKWKESYSSQLAIADFDMNKRPSWQPWRRSGRRPSGKHKKGTPRQSGKPGNSYRGDQSDKGFLKRGSDRHKELHRGKKAVAKAKEAKEAKKAKKAKK